MRPDDKEIAAKLKECEEKLKRCQNELSFYKEALRVLPNPIFVKDEKLQYVFFNKQYENFFGIDANTLIGKKVEDLEYLELEDRKRYAKEDEELVNNSSIVHYNTKVTGSDNHEYDVLYWSKGFESKNKLRGVIGELVNISYEIEARKQIEKYAKMLRNKNKKIKLLSKLDSLTTLYNRSILKHSISKLIEQYKVNNTVFSAIIMDLDNFKNINDNFGHIYGDKILKKFASIIKKQSRDKDIAIRYGGEEFLLLLPETNMQKAISVAERIRTKAEKKLILPNNETCTVSIGIAMYQENESPESLLTRTDQALYKSKELGKNKISISANKENKF